MTVFVRCVFVCVCRRGVPGSGPGHGDHHPTGVGGRRGPVRGQHRPPAHVSGPAQGTPQANAYPKLNLLPYTGFYSCLDAAQTNRQPTPKPAPLHMIHYT